MSFYRTLIATVAAMSLVTVAFAAEENANSATPAPTENSAKAVQVAEQSTTTTETTVQTTETQATKVNINTATTKELMKAGLSKAKASAIVSFRKKNGNFTSVDDIKKIAAFKKMKDAQFKKIQDQLTVG